MYYQLYILYIVVIIFLLFCIYLLWKTKRKDILINHLKLLSDYSPNPMFQLDNDRYITGCNKAFETFLWKSKEDIIGKTMFDIMDEEVARIHDEVDRDLIAKGGEIRYEGTLIHADGTSHNVILNKRLIGGVKYSGILCDIVDVSSDSQMQDQINSINDEYLMLLDNIPIQVWYLTDKETYGKIR